MIFPVTLSRNGGHGDAIYEESRSLSHSSQRDKLSLEKETCKFRLHTKTKTKKFRTLYLLTSSVMKTVSSVYAV